MRRRASTAAALPPPAVPLLHALAAAQCDVWEAPESSALASYDVERVVVVCDDGVVLVWAPSHRAWQEVRSAVMVLGAPLERGESGGDPDEPTPPARPRRRRGRKRPAPARARKVREKVREEETHRGPRRTAAASEARTSRRRSGGSPPEGEEAGEQPAPTCAGCGEEMPRNKGRQRTRCDRCLSPKALATRQARERQRQEQAA